MNQFDKLPKNVKKTIRYISQDVSLDQLLLLKKHLAQAIKEKEKEFYKKRN